MRWQADLAQIDTFRGVLATIGKVCKKTGVHVSKKEMRFVMTSQLGCTETEEVFVRLNAEVEGSVFANYLVESRRNNNIYFTLDIKNLVAALRVADPNNTSVSMKLAKKLGGEFLTVTWRTTHAQVTHDVPIE